MTFRFYSNAEVLSSLLVKSWHLVLAQPSLPPSSENASPQPGSGWVCQGNRTAEVGGQSHLGDHDHTRNEGRGTGKLVSLFRRRVGSSWKGTYLAIQKIMS